MKYAGATLMLVLLPVLATTLYAQTLYPALPSKTRIKFERQLTSATEHIPCEKAYDGEGLSPRVWTLPTDIKALLEDSCTALPIVNKEKTMAFLVFYAYEHPDETNVMLGWAKHLLEKYGHAFEKHSLPPALAYFPLVSSDMSPDYVSGNGGVGNWKFKYSTARLYGLMVDKYIDERRLPDKSTWAAAHMLENFYTSFETYPLAVAAWICGPARVHKALKNTSNNNKFREVFSLLPEPEIDSYHAFTALNILLHNTGKFDLSPVVVGTENPKDTVFIIDTLHFGQVADLTGIDKQSLEMLNPHYVKNIVPASAQTSLPLFLPHGTRKAFLTHLDTIYHYRDSFYFKKAIPKTKTLTPGSDYVPVQYTIKSGDNIGFLSEWFDTPAASIRYWNNIRGNFIRAGQTIVVYVSKDKKSHYTALETMSFAEKQAREGEIVSKTSQKQNITETLKHGTYILYTVQLGDNPWQIAKQYPGISNQDILRWNNINPHDLRPGQKLKIKKQQGSK